MFSDRLKKFIMSYVGRSYIGNAEADLAIFEKVLTVPSPDERLDGVNELFPQYLEDMAASMTPEELVSNMANFTQIEPFAKFLFALLEPARYAIAPCDEAGGMPETNWTLAPLFKQGLRVVPMNVNLRSESNCLVSFPYKEHYFQAYKVRNQDAHFFACMDQRELFGTITSCLIVFLDICHRKESQLAPLLCKESIREQFNAKEYCRNLIKKHEAEAKRRGFTYVDICWQKKGEEVRCDNVRELMASRIGGSRKFLGEAGSGKTTVLRQMAYLDAKQMVNGSGKMLPVYIELAKLEKNADAEPKIMSLIAAELGVDNAACEQILKSQQVSLYLDGFNEILDTGNKKKFSWSVDELADRVDIPGVNICLSNRAVVRNAIDTLRNAETYHLYPLSLAMKRSYIEGNSPDEETKQVLLSEMDHRPEYYDGFKTPLQLQHLVLLTSRSKSVSEDPDGDFIEYLMDREMNEKNDPNVEYLREFCEALALKDKESLSIREAEKCMAVVKQCYGYTIPDTKGCLKLLTEMGILVQETTSDDTNNQACVRFAREAYQFYFWTMAAEDGLEEDLGGSI